MKQIYETTGKHGAYSKSVLSVLSHLESTSFYIAKNNFFIGKVQVLEKQC